MKLKHLEKRLMSLVLTSALALGVLPTLPASADWQWMDETTPEIPETPVDTTGLGNFISPPIQAVRGFLPSQGDAGLVILYVDFPDCPYDYAPSMEELESIAFGPENTSHEHYPFESASAYYERASKGSMHLYGKAFRYTAQYNNDAYDDVVGRQTLLREALMAFDEAEDFSQYDGDNDGFIDTVLLSVPKAAGDDNWWPCAGPLDDENFFVDGKKVGHIITGNAQVESPTNYIVFNETILHEMGHCMGLPDYYLYHGEDFTGLHGAAGSELMDDGYADFGCVSKLQYGWYREKQIEVFDSSKTTETYTLHNAQTDAGNVLVIPCGELDGQYHSEYMLVEYMTEDRNNSHPGWWMLTGSGIRVYHVDATIKEDYWWPSFMYGSGEPATNNDEGRRLLRVIDDRNVDNLYRTGDVIDGNISGFHWYDNNGGQTVDTGIMIQVGELTENGYEITVTQSNAETEITHEPLKGHLISSLEVLDTKYYASWSIDTEANVGDTVFGDRTADKSAISALPVKLENAELVLTPCDAKASSNDQAKLTAAKDITVYIGFDARVTAAPAWVSDWTKDSETVQTVNGVTFILYSKEVKEGETVTLGANGQSTGCVNYIVLASAGSVAAKIRGDVNLDGIFDVADVVLLQKWLLAVPETHLADWKTGDLCEDDRLDVFDLCLMKQELVNR